MRFSHEHRRPVHHNRKMSSATRCAKKRIPFLALVLILLSLTGCTTSNDKDIRDIRFLPQDAKSYLPDYGAERGLVEADRQKQLDQHFNSIFFSPWRRSQPYYDKETIAAKHERFVDNPGYGENRRAHDAQWALNLIHNAGMEDYPNRRSRAITVTNADLRELPTTRPHFNDFRLAGEGYPFDNLQYSAIAANTPVFISHASRDKEWALVESHYGVGWVPARDIALVDQAFIDRWESGDYVAIIKDEAPIVDQDGIFRFKASLGSLYPKIGEDETGFDIMVAASDEMGGAVPRIARIPGSSAARKPLELTRANIAMVVNELMNKPYGWGGMLQNRDCSSTTKDLFSPFGLWLPRHSGDQAQSGGLFIDLSTPSVEEKEETIARQGVPFLTLLWLKGHIMLYMGRNGNELLVFHNKWGIRTTDLLGREGRKIIGHAAITTLHPGAELPDVDASDNLLQRIQGMTILPSIRDSSL